MADLGTDPYRRGLRLRILRLLAASPRNGGEDAVERYYELRDSRALAVAKGTGAAAVSLLTAWLIPFLKDGYGGAPRWLVVLVPAALVIGLATFSLAAVMRLDRIHSSYARAMALLQLFR